MKQTGYRILRFMLVFAICSSLMTVTFFAAFAVDEGTAQNALWQWGARIFAASVAPANALIAWLHIDEGATVFFLKLIVTVLVYSIFIEQLWYWLLKLRSQASN